MADRVILHSDLNCFFASVETVLEPAYRGRAIAVCGSTENRHGIVLAKSEAAKRAGVKTGMVNAAAAALCPGLIMVPPHFSYYLKFSELVQQIYRSYTDQVESYGMDECWLDVTGSMRRWENPRTLADDIRLRVRRELGLTVSIGVSFNKVFAKLGSDMKKPDAVTEITKENFRDTVWRLPAADLLYVGKATEKKLAMLGITTIGGLAQTPRRVLKNLLGVNGEALWCYANGTDQARVMQQDFSPVPKSVGHGATCRENLETEQEVWQVLFALCQDVSARLRSGKLTARRVCLTVKGTDLRTEQLHAPLSYATSLSKVLARAAFDEFRKRYRWNTPVRALTLTAIDLTAMGMQEQLDLMTDYSRVTEQETIEKTMDTIHRRFGKQSLSYGALLHIDKLPIDGGHEQVILPGHMYQ